MDAVRLGKQGLVGWREKVADGLAGPLSSRSPLSEDQVRALIGAAFFALSVYYVVDTVRRAAAESE
jgi:hypothetical protein